ncbi:MAG: hypothetical protein ABEK03_03880 [Candidatus Bipolaricaulia bacterium]
MVKWLGLVLAILLQGVGVIWILQGSGLLPGSFMTGEVFWVYMGMVSVGVGLLVAIASAWAIGRAS